MAKDTPRLSEDDIELRQFAAQILAAKYARGGGVLDAQRAVEIAVYAAELLQKKLDERKK